MMELCETCIRNGTNECRGHILYRYGKTHILSCTGYKETNMEEEFTKDMLKDGMVIETRVNDLYLVCGDMLMGMDGTLHLSYYNDDMTHAGSDLWSRDKRFDILKVYDKVNYLRQLAFHNIYSKPLWERKEIKEVTLKEIAEKFGVDEVKVIEA